MLLGLRFAQPVLAALAGLTRRVPRSHYLVDMALDWLRQDPAPSTAVLEGILFHRSAPPHSERLEMDEPALVIGHPSDPLHPFSDAGMLVEEMPNAQLIDANSILEWRLTPAPARRPPRWFPGRGLRGGRRSGRRAHGTARRLTR